MVNEDGREADYPTTAGAFFVMLTPFAEGLVEDWRLNGYLNSVL